VIVPPTGVKGTESFSAVADGKGTGLAEVIVILKVLEVIAPLASFTLKVMSLKPLAEGRVEQLIYRLEVTEQKTTPGFVWLTIS
jgi:hypothetical protein